MLPKLIGHPDVPPGEVWPTFGEPTRQVVFQRFPHASATSCKIRPAKRVTNYPFKVILLNPETLVEELQGDSDGDEGFAGYIPGEPKAPRVTISRRVLTGEWNLAEIRVKDNPDWDSLYDGYTATRWIGQIIQAVWVLQYAHASNGQPEVAACQVWDFATKLIEQVMDQRKLKADGAIDPRHAIRVLRGQEQPCEQMLQLPYAKEVLATAAVLPLSQPEPGPYTIMMRRARPRAVLQTLNTPPDQLIEQLWSGRLGEVPDATGVKLDPGD